MREILPGNIKIHVVFCGNQLHLFLEYGMKWKWKNRETQVFPTFIYTSCVVSGSTTLMHMNLFECHSISRLILFQ